MVGRKATRSKSNHARSTLMATKLTCADLQKSTLDRLSIFHCSNCDLYNNERNTCMAFKKLLTQDKWGRQFRCTRPVTNPIRVRVVNSAWLGENYPSSATPPSTTPPSTTPPSTETTNPPVCMPVHDSSRCGDDCCVPPDTGIRVATANYKKRKQDEAFDAVTRELEEVKRQKRELEEKLKKMKGQCWCHHVPKKNDAPSMDQDVLRTQLRLDIELAATKRLKNKHKKTKAKIVLSMLQTGELFGEDSKTVVEQFVTNSARAIFKAWKMQKAIDTGPAGGLNYGAVESIRKIVEELGRYERGILPSSSVIQKEAAALEEYASNEDTGCLPYEKSELKKW
jgi:hypothetical protein